MILFQILELMRKSCLKKKRFVIKNNKTFTYPDQPELIIEDSENIPIQFFATKCTKMIHKILKR